MSGDSSDGTRSIVTSSSEATSVESVNVHGDCRMILHNGLTLVPNHRTPCVSTYPYGRQLSSDGKRLRALLRPLEEYDRIWSFSGIVESQRKRLEDGSENIRGYVWYETRKFGPELKIEDGYVSFAPVLFGNSCPLPPGQEILTRLITIFSMQIPELPKSASTFLFCKIHTRQWLQAYSFLDRKSCSRTMNRVSEHSVHLQSEPGRTAMGISPFHLDIVQKSLKMSALLEYPSRRSMKGKITSTGMARHGQEISRMLSLCSRICNTARFSPLRCFGQNIHGPSSVVIALGIRKPY